MRPTTRRPGSTSAGSVRKSAAAPGVPARPWSAPDARPASGEAARSLSERPLDGLNPGPPQGRCGPRPALTLPAPHVHRQATSGRCGSATAGVCAATPAITARRRNAGSISVPTDDVSLFPAARARAEGVPASGPPALFRTVEGGRTWPSGARQEALSLRPGLVHSAATASRQRGEGLGGFRQQRRQPHVQGVVRSATSPTFGANIRARSVALPLLRKLLEDFPGTADWLLVNGAFVMHFTSFGLLVQAHRPEAVAHGPVPIVRQPSFRSVWTFFETCAARVKVALRH